MPNPAPTRTCAVCGRAVWAMDKGIRKRWCYRWVQYVSPHDDDCGKGKWKEPPDAHLG
jgi:hypothetical protein